MVRYMIIGLWATFIHFLSLYYGKVENGNLSVKKSNVGRSQGIIQIPIETDYEYKKMNQPNI